MKGLKKSLILIVDDNPKNLQVLGKMLQEQDCEIEYAIDGKTALEWLKEKGFDIILLDINMPGMNGFEVCRYIKSDPVLRKIPVIFLSAETDRDSILKGFEIGAQDYITKPFDMRELMARVNTHLALKRSLEMYEDLNASLEEKVLERTQQLKEANVKLEDLDKSKSEFMQMISHEIRTPLNGIAGPVYLLKEMKMSEELISLVEVLDQSVRRLERFSLITLLITQLRTQTGKIPEKEISLKELVSKCLAEDSIDKLINDKNIKMTLSEAISGTKITCNSDLVMQSISCVLENAIKHSVNDGIIKITIGNENNSTILDIENEGPGLAAGLLKKINDLLSSNDFVINYNLGIDLNLAKYVMAHHSGRVEMANRNNGVSVRLIFNR